MLRRELFLLAGRWCHPDRGLFREERDRMLARNGNRKTKTLCDLARRLVPVLLHIMQTGEEFDRERFLADRFRNGLRRRRELTQSQSSRGVGDGPDRNRDMSHELRVSIVVRSSSGWKRL